jgi:hypothetical protein
MKFYSKMNDFHQEKREIAIIGIDEVYKYIHSKNIYLQ